MAKIIIAIGDAKKGSGKTYKLVLENDESRILFGKKIGDHIQLAQTKDNVLEITGGSDVSGFPMRRDNDGLLKKKIFLAGGVGYKPKFKGCKDKKTVAGNTVYEGTAQVNLKLVKEGKDKLETIFPKVEATEEKK